MASQQYFQVQLKRSGAGRSATHRATLKGLGLTRMGKTVYCKDTAAIRGMLYSVGYLIQVQPAAGPVPPSARARARAAASK